MIIRFDEESLLERKETELTDENGELLYTGIYDFSYKYRTRLFSKEGTELGYVELDVTEDRPTVLLCDSKGTVIGRLVEDEGLYLEPGHEHVEGDKRSFHLNDRVTKEEGSLSVMDSDLKYLLLMYAMIEIERGRHEEE